MLCVISSWTALPTPVPLVNHDEAWSYHKGTNAPQSDWKTATDASLDATWVIGNGGFGFADNTPESANCQTLLTEMAGSYTTLYLRRQFAITNTIAPGQHLMLRMDWDDGFIAWLNGNYLASGFVNGAPAEPAYTNTASGNHESSLGNSTPQLATTLDLGPASDWLDVGTHTLAIIGLNVTSGSSDFIQVADLFLDVPPLQITNVWVMSNSPIVITTNLTIPNNTTLIIEPGVTVALAADVHITVADGGRLLAEGTSNAPIRFTGSSPSEFWGNLTINGAERSPESRLVYVEFELNANSTGTPCIDVNGGTAFLDHLNFGNTGAPYIHVDGASFVISHCHFPSATAQFELCHGTGGIKLGGHGIFLRNFFGQPIGYNDVVDFTGGNRPGPIVHFIENVLVGSDDDGFDLDGTDAWVEGNIFLHVHKNRGTPDSAAAVSGGNSGSATSEITVVGNIFYDCDQAATAKQGNFYVFLNNTIVHQTHQGGVDTDGAVVAVADAGTAQGAGAYFEGNIIYDAEQLVRNLTNAILTFTNNLMPFAWMGSGGGNSTNDPMLKYIPQLSETSFTNWQQAQILRDWFGLLPGSPAIGAGADRRDMGALVSRGVVVSGEPTIATSANTATLTIGFNRAGNAIPTTAWPAGFGYTHYRWRLAGNVWSAATPIATPLSLTNLAVGSHLVEVSGQLNSGLYQDDPLFGELAVPTVSRTWQVAPAKVIEKVFLTSSNTIAIQFTAQANTGYQIEARDSLSTGTWRTLVVLDPIASVHSVTFVDPDPLVAASRFYRLAP